MVITYGEKNEYHSHDFCPECESMNIVDIRDVINGNICEAKTICTVCGHTNYWAYGVFQEPFINDHISMVK